MQENLIEVVVDVETTGLDFSKERIIEFAGVKLKDGEIIDTFELLVNPEIPIKRSAQMVHGIKDEDLADAPKELDAYNQIFEFIGDAPIVAHNAIFDYTFLNYASKRVLSRPFVNNHIDTQVMYKELYPQVESSGLTSMMNTFNVEFDTRHRAMADAMGLAKCYPALKNMYYEKYAWQKSQIPNIRYLFERYLRLQSAISTMQSEIQDLRSVFRLYFDEGGKDIVANTGETLSYNTKRNYTYDYAQIKEILDELGLFENAVKINTTYVDRLTWGNKLDDEVKDRIRACRAAVNENRTLSVKKPDNN